MRYGKGRKSSVVPCPEGVAVAIERWLVARNSLLAESQIETDRSVFSLTKGHKPRTRNLRTDAIFKALAQRAKRSGVQTFLPHDLRRTYIGDLLDAGADLVTAQKLAGYSDPKTTVGYDCRDHLVQRSAARTKIRREGNWC